MQNSWTGHKSFYYSAGRKSKGKEDEREEFSKSAVNSLVLLSLWLFVGLWGTRRTRSLDDVEEKLKMLGRAGKGNRTRVESSQEGFYGQSIIFSMCNRCGRRTMIPKILGIRKQPRASVSTSFRCGRPILHCNSIQKWFLNFPALFFCLLGALTGLATIWRIFDFVLFRWRKRNHLSYLRTKSNYEASNLASGTMAASTLPPERLSEHPLIYDDANIHFYRTSGTSTYLLDSSRGPSRSTMVRDISSLSSQVH